MRGGLDEPAADTLPTAPSDTFPAGVAADPDPQPAAVSGAPADTLPGADDPVITAAGDTIPADSVPARPPLSESADSVLRSLRQLEGFTVTEYRGNDAVYRANEGVLRLEGDAEVLREGDRLTADTIVYRDREELVQAYGSPRVVGEAQEIEGNVLFYDLATRRATALGARTEVRQQATWYVSGDMTVEGSDRIFGSHARFTSCDLEIPHYHFESDQVMVVRDRILVARPARLYFGNVPVMVLPFVVHNLEQGRRSGFLTPRFGVHDVVRTSSGYNRQISDLGFYWAISEYAGARISTTWRSGAYTALDGTLDYRWRRQFLDGNVGVQRYWRADGGRELSFNTRSSWQPDEVTSLSMTGRYASSADFVRDASYDPREVTQDLASNFSLRRQFGWGSASLGAQRRQSIASGDVSMTLPSFSISPRQITLFRAPTPEQARWFSNATFTPGVISGSRSLNDYADDLSRNRDRQETQLRVQPSFSIGNFRLNADGELNRSMIEEGLGTGPDEDVVELPGYDHDEASWSASAQYQQSLIGTTNIAPNIRLGQELLRDPITGDEFLRAPMRLSFGASLNSDLYGFFPGVGPFSAIRNRLSPRVSYSYAPEVQQTALQEEVFGRAGGRAQNRISIGVNQTWEAKLSNPRPVEEEPVDTVPGDSIGDRSRANAPSDPEKVTILSLTTSALEYDFIQAREEGTGFVTNVVSNSIDSDYLRGLRVNMQHELFDRRDLDPDDPANAGQLGSFAPRLSSLSTSFNLGPQSSVVQMLERFTDRLGLGGDQVPEDDAILQGTPEEETTPDGTGTSTANPQGTGGGPWRVGMSYQFSRPSRRFTRNAALTDQAIQTLNADMDFQLSPNWAVTWATSYSLTDGEFGSHRLNFRRDLHEWQANFSFYQTPNGNTAFEFYVELLHNRDLRFDYSESDLGVDR